MLMLSFSEAGQTAFSSFTLQCSVPSFLNSLWSNMKNANQNEVRGCLEISISNSTPNSPNGSQLSLQQGQTEFVIALSIQPGTLAAINLVLKEGKNVVSEWMSAALQSSPSLPANSHVTGAFSVP